MMKFDKFKGPVPVLCAVLVVFTLSIQLCQCDSYQPEPQQQSQQQQQQNNNNNGYSSPSTPPFVQSHRYRNSNHQTRNVGGWGYPTESRTVVPLFLPMILFVGIVLLLFFAVVGSAAVAGGAAGIGRRVGVPTHRNSFARDFSTSAALARDVLSSEQCVERISCEVFRVAKGYKAQNWMLSTEFPSGEEQLDKTNFKDVVSKEQTCENKKVSKGELFGFPVLGCHCVCSYCQETT